MTITNKFENGTIAWEIFTYTEIIEQSGTLGVIETGRDIKFDVRRIFYLKGLAPGSERGFHSHLELRQVLICLKGSLDLLLDAGVGRQKVSMSENSEAVFVDGRVWREMKNFSDDAFLLVLCDREYSKDIVIRDYETFQDNLPKA